MPRGTDPICTNPACITGAPTDSATCWHHIAANHTVYDARGEILLTGPDVNVNSECSDCGNSLHLCGYERLAGCSFCRLCLDCVDRNRHAHCQSCGYAAPDDRICANCENGTCCVVMDSNNACERCNANDGNASDLDSDYDSDDDYSDSRSVIRGYSNRDYPAFRPAFKPNYLYLGVELETEHPGSPGDNERAAREIYDQFPDDIIVKHDSSLRNGYECVTGPFGLSEHAVLWPKLAPAMSAAGSRSWGHESTGMHVHMSRSFFTPMMIGKMQVFLNSDQTREMVTKLAGRSGNHYAKLVKKRLTEVYGDDRYDALNLTNEQTIEIRIFKGTLNVEHILANIEFCDALAHWVIDASVTDCEHWDRFMTYVIQHRKLYQRLINYLARFEITEDSAKDDAA